MHLRHEIRKGSSHRRGTVVRAGKDFEVIARNDIGEPITASPVFADGRLYLRTLKSLYAIGPQ